jgi:hypothetical protein
MMPPELGILDNSTFVFDRVPPQAGFSSPNFDTWMPKFADFGLLASMISIGWVHERQKSCSYMKW